MKKGTLILITGTVGAGKTTLAKQLAVERDAHRFCPDDWTLTLLKDGYDIPERDRVHDLVEQLQWTEAQDLLQRGLTVILENGFWTKSERDMYRDTGKRLGANVELHAVEAPLDVLWSRVQKRNTNAHEFVLTYEEVERSQKVFEAPTDDEGKTYDHFTRYSISE